MQPGERAKEVERAIEEAAKAIKDEVARIYRRSAADEKHQVSEFDLADTRPILLTLVRRIREIALE